MYRSLKSSNSVRFSSKSHNYSYGVAAILKNGRHFDYYRSFNVDIMMLYISVRDHARKLKFSSSVHLPSINKMFQYRYA